DQLFREGPQFLGLGLGGDHPAVDEQARRHVVQQSALVRCGPGELPPLGAVPHGYCASAVGVGCGAGGVPGCEIRRSPSTSSNRMPKLSPSRWSRSAISWIAFSPTFLTLSRSSSLNSTRSRSVRMFEFLSELSERTESPKSSISRLSRWRRLPGVGAT